MTEAVELSCVSKRFKEVLAVKGVTLSIRNGEVFGVVGPSGSGKSTLLRIVDFLEVPEEGTVAIRGEVVRPGSRRADEMRRLIGMVLQKPVVLNRSVANNLAYSLLIRGWDEDNIKGRVGEELRKLGLEGRKAKNARTLSGGEMQRLSFARSTIFGPDLLLLDEFAANLDPKNVALLEEQVTRYVREDRSRAVMIVTHNIFQARRMCDRLALMWDGEVIEVADKKKFFQNPDDERTAAFVSGDAVF